MKIIYIDDDPISQVVLKDMLAAAGVVVAAADSAAQGLKMIAAARYDLVIMDLRMPGVSGLTAIRQLRARETPNGRAPIIVISAELTEGTRNLCRDAGADRFLCKPVAAADLFHELGVVLAQSSAIMA